MELTPPYAVQSDGGALREGGGSKPGRHGSVRGDLVGGDGRPRQELQRRGGKKNKNKHPGIYEVLTYSSSRRRPGGGEIEIEPGTLTDAHNPDIEEI